MPETEAEITERHMEYQLLDADWRANPSIPALSRRNEAYGELVDLLNDQGYMPQVAWWD